MQMQESHMAFGIVGGENVLMVHNNRHEMKCDVPHIAHISSRRTSLMVMCEDAAGISH